jgi:hypothetical protein
MDDYFKEQLEGDKIRLCWGFTIEPLFLNWLFFLMN